jgi:hypothetical protein
MLFLEAGAKASGSSAQRPLKAVAMVSSLGIGLE